MAGSQHLFDIVPVDLVDELLDQEAPGFKQRLRDGPARAAAAMGKRMAAAWPSSCDPLFVPPPVVRLGVELLLDAGADPV